jgi:hypothetical protein
VVRPDVPPIVPDLDWSPERARTFGGRVLDLYAGLLTEIVDGPVSPRVTTASVQAAVTTEIPEEPLARPSDLSQTPLSGGGRGQVPLY